MGDKTGIEWTDATWTPLRARNTATDAVGWHCEHKSSACANCFAEALNLRLGTKLPFKPGHLRNGDVVLFLDEAMILQPLRWQRPRDVFVCSMTDLFAAFMKRKWIVQVFAVMALAKHHRFQVLTKRPQRMFELLNDPKFAADVDKVMDGLAPEHWHDRELADVGGWPLKNVMVGTSAGDQSEANENLCWLVRVDAARIFLSYEPACGPVDLMAIDNDGEKLDVLNGSVLVDGEWERGPRKLDWVIAAGESGDSKRKARPAHPAWFRSMRDQCSAAKVPFFFKQWGDWEPREEWSPRDAKGRFEPMVAVMADGSECPHEAVPQDVGAHRMARVGKKKSGALLDGREHKDSPR